MLIAIVDDIEEERILLRTRLENILDQKNVEFHCYEYENGEAFLKASKEHDFTVLFLDIYMNGRFRFHLPRSYEILSRIPASEKKLTVKVNGSDLQIPFKTIIHADHFSHMIHIHTTKEKELVIRQSFGTFTTPLKEDSRFFICNRGTIINMEHAVDFDGTMFLLDDGSKIVVSRELCKPARQHFMDYLFQKGGF